MYCTVLPADQSFHRLPVSSTKMAASLPAGHSYFHNSCRSSVCLIEAEARLRSGVAVGVTSRTIYSPVNVMATVSDLKAVLADTLDKRGVLGQLKARVRAEVFAALDDQSEPKPVLSHENLLINEMIREYLEFNKYKYTSSVLTAETGLSDIPLDRCFLSRELNLSEVSSAQSVPILYGLLAHFLHGHKEVPCPSTMKHHLERSTQWRTENAAVRTGKRNDELSL
ncbi:centrosomal protein 20 isoform X2 [Hyla sarda]|uniref:centrosomal protein 20 isoform X2 n=1 Tax=Hyla sarda TaxID=327740 RepID=UPI0024C2EC38|nr:centrosomal protein 20 isoform X2 [Hyla sarda]